MLWFSDYIRLMRDSRGGYYFHANTPLVYIDIEKLRELEKSLSDHFQGEKVG